MPRSSPCCCAATVVPMRRSGLGRVGVMVVAVLVVIGDTKLFCGPREHLQRLLGPFFVFLGAVIIVGGLSPYVNVA